MPRTIHNNCETLPFAGITVSNLYLIRILRTFPLCLGFFFPHPSFFCQLSDCAFLELCNLSLFSLGSAYLFVLYKMLSELIKPSSLSQTSHTHQLSCLAFTAASKPVSCLVLVLIFYFIKHFILFIPFL